MQEVPAVFGEQQHRAQHAVDLLLDDVHQLLEHPRQRHALGQHLEHVALSREQEQQLVALVPREQSLEPFGADAGVRVEVGRLIHWRVHDETSLRPWFAEATIRPFQE